MTSKETELEGKANAEDVEINPFAWSVPLQVDEETDQFLNSAQVNTPEEEQVPREVISEALGSARFQAELSRPLYIGVFRGLPAYLLKTRFSFQRITTNWFSRIQAVDITIVFEDAPEAGSKGLQHPAVAAYYPELFEGEVSREWRTDKLETSLSASYVVGASLTVGQSKTKVQEGKVIVHGVRGGGRNRNAITWSIEEDHIAKVGLPRTIELPLIVTRESRGRFSARVTVKAHYGFWRGAVARSVPVLGKNDSPLFFDPTSLDSLAENGKNKGPDGQLIVEQAGIFDDLDLANYSTFRTTKLK